MTIELYAQLTSLSLNDPVILALSSTLFIMGMIVMTINYPIFGLQLFSKKFKKEYKIALAFYGTLVATISVLTVILKEKSVFITIQRILLICSYIFFIGCGILSWLQSQIDFKNKINILFFIITISSFPAILPLNNQSSPYVFIYLIIISVSTSIVGIVAFRLPSHMDKDVVLKNLKTLFSISDREAEVTWFLANGMSAKNIGEKLFISSKTVQNHTASIYKKTGVNSRFQLIQLINLKIGTIT